ARGTRAANHVGRPAGGAPGSIPTPGPGTRLNVVRSIASAGGRVTAGVSPRQAGGAPSARTSSSAVARSPAAGGRGRDRLTAGPGVGVPAARGGVARRGVPQPAPPPAIGQGRLLVDSSQEAPRVRPLRVGDDQQVPAAVARRPGKTECLVDRPAEFGPAVVT